MKFLEAYQWMNESKDNVCLRAGVDSYKVMNGSLMVFHEEWKMSLMCVSNLNKCKCKWEKQANKNVIIFREVIVYFQDNSSALEWVTSNYFSNNSLLINSYKSHWFTGKTKKVEVPE